MQSAHDTRNIAIVDSSSQINIYYKVRFMAYFSPAIRMAKT